MLPLRCSAHQAASDAGGSPDPDTTATVDLLAGCRSMSRGSVAAIGDLGCSRSLSRDRLGAGAVTVWAGSSTANSSATGGHPDTRTACQSNGPHEAMKQREGQPGQAAPLAVQTRCRSKTPPPDVSSHSLVDEVLYG